MTFLDPTSGLVAAAIAGPALVVLYLLRLRRRPLRVSSTLLWDQAIKDLQVNVPFRWLRPSLIFFLQLAALAAFTVALARPAVQGPAPVADQVVIVIDHTASMSATDAASVPGTPSTRLDAAKRRAGEFVAQLARSSGMSGGRPMVQIVSSAALARIRCALTSDTREAIDQIDAIEATDQSGADGEPGVSAAVSLLTSAAAASVSDAESTVRPRPEIVVFSDAPLPAAAASLGARLISIADPARSSRDNAGIVALNARRDAVEPAAIHIFARLASASPRPRRLSLRLLVNGGLALAREVELPAAPGDAPLSLSIRHAESCTLVLTIDTPDILAADNSAAVYLDAASSAAILLVAPATDGKPDPDPFLIGALESVRPRQLRTITRDAYERECEQARTDRRRPWPLFSIIVFDRIEPVTIPPQPTLSFGAGLPVDGLRLTEGEPPAPPASSRFTSWRRAHPILRYVALDPLVIAPPPPAIDTVAALPAAATSVVPLAFGPTATGADAPIIAAMTAPSRPDAPLRVVVSFPLARSNWGPDHSFPIFISNTVEALTGQVAATTARSWTTSEPVVVMPTQTATEVLVFGADGGDEPVRRVPIATGEAAPAPVSLGVFPRAGVHTLRGCEPPAACINLLSSAETLLPSPRQPATTGAATSATSADGPTPPGEPRPGQREVWHWFLLAGIIIAAVEWVIFARGMRA